MVDSLPVDDVVAAKDRWLVVRRRWPWQTLTIVCALAIWAIVMSLVHLSQGTADINFQELWSALFSSGVSDEAAVLVESRLPRLLAAILTGGALGMAGAALQSVTRNPLASPETVGVGAGAYLGLTIASLLGLGLAPFAGLGIAFACGLAPAAAVLALSAPGRSTGPLRLILAGSAITMGLGSLTSILLLLNPWETQGMFAWGAGTLSQNGMSGVASMIPIAVLSGLVLILLGRQLDLLQLGDEAATSLGVKVGTIRRCTVVLAVLLIAASVTVTGPIGFVGLCAPAIVRLLARRTSGLRLQRPFLLASTLAGFGLILTADIGLRATFGAVKGIAVPVGVLTSIIGAILLVLLTRRLPRDGAEGDTIASMHAGIVRGIWPVRLVIVGATIILCVLALAGILVGDKTLLLGDLSYWLQGVASPRVDFIFSTRIPRVVGALLAGAALGLAGLLVQSITRNPLADPGVLGVSSSAGAGAVAVITLTHTPTDSAIFAAAACGAVFAAVCIFLFGRGDQFRLIITGIAVGASAGALITLLLVRSDPWDQTRAMTWLGGSTYSTTAAHMVPLVALLAVAAVVVFRTRRDLDLMQFDETTPRVLGVEVKRSRLLHVALAVALTAAATAAVGVFSFVGLIAPHLSRVIVGKKHGLAVPLTMLLGATVVVVADIVGRVVIAPAQLPAGLIVAVVGTPFFLWLLYRSQPSR
ncbi:iron ABC transporter permease [Tsukamurella tyrosinosolvens]|uniref:iron ABC transporter permease n=1 Tax=Tsukamurella tyrosinosolvens TaxID=57704 RepID=UPI0036ADCEAC